MPRNFNWENRIGRRLKLRDLHVFSTVVQRGSMAQAAAYLGISQPAVSEIMTELESTLGVRLLERSTRGVEPTKCGHALLKHSTVVFDELKQTVKDIELLSDPAAGELRIGCVDSIASTILAPVIDQFSKRYPRATIQVNQLISSDVELMRLRGQSLDIVLTRYLLPFANEKRDLSVEILFDDNIVIVAGNQSRWAKHGKIELDELVEGPWLLTPPQSANYTILAAAFRERGLDVPKAYLWTYSVELRIKLLAAGPYLTSFSRSIVTSNGDRSIKVLPVDLPIRPWPVAIVTLKNRPPSLIAQHFIDHLRAFTREIGHDPRASRKAVVQPAV